MIGMKSFASASRFALGCLSSLVLLTLLTSGCQTPTSSVEAEFSQYSGDSQGAASEVLRPGDVLNITFKGPSIQIPEHEERIPESGQISLAYIGKVDVLGKTREKLQDDILAKYVPKYFKELTVTIAPGDRYFYVGGEVKTPNRYPYGNKMTVTAAISTAGGFTDFASRSKVQLIRATREKMVINCKKALKDARYDQEVLPGDRIYVPRRYF